MGVRRPQKIRALYYIVLTLSKTLFFRRLTSNAPSVVVQINNDLGERAKTSASPYTFLTCGARWFGIDLSPSPRGRYPRSDPSQDGYTFMVFPGARNALLAQIARIMTRDIVFESLYKQPVLEREGDVVTREDTM